MRLRNSLVSNPSKPVPALGGCSHTHWQVKEQASQPHGQVLSPISPPVSKHIPPFALHFQN